MTPNRTRAEKIVENYRQTWKPYTAEIVGLTWLAVIIEQALDEAVRDAHEEWIKAQWSSDVALCEKWHKEGTLAGLEMVERECNDKLCHCTMVVERLRAKAKELEVQK